MGLRQRDPMICSGRPASCAAARKRSPRRMADRRSRRRKAFSIQRPPHRAAPDHRAGYAVIDAVVGLSILAATLILAFGAVGTAGRLAAAAAEARHANVLLRFLIDSSTGTIGVVTGRDEMFDWKVENRPAANPATGRGLSLCARQGELVSRRSGRRYALATQASCRTGDGG